jgi:apolipoprotein D and lipocalin family protein
MNLPTLFRVYKPKPLLNMNAARPFPYLSAPRLLLLGLLAASLSGCQSSASRSAKAEPLRAINRHIQLDRFMGDWYVIAHIPTFIEKKAYNAVERYELAPDGTIKTTFFFNKGAYDGPLKTYTPRGFVYNRDTNAEWRMRFVWPFKAAYLITYLDADYQTTVIGVPDRDYAWIMARTKTISEARYAELIRFLVETGHDVSNLRRVPQR